MGTSQEDTATAILAAELSSTPYRVIGMLGQGGMGSVFEVEHKTLRRRLVIKILRDPGRPDLEDRLRLEAQTLAQLSHPNLLSVVDYSETASGRPFIVSERLRGATLKDHIGPTGSLPPATAIRYVIEALSGLAVAHRAGIVHRDVKLDNLFLCEGDELSPARVKVLDFGIAKLVGAGSASQAVNVDPLANPTAEGQMVGTPSFMSPEQVTNAKVDHRADLYGVGVVLYRLLTGRNPFICKDLMEFAVAHASEIPQPPSRWAALPPGLDAVVMRALEKSPDARFASAKAMIDALEPFLSAAPATLPAQQFPIAAAPQTMVAIADAVRSPDSVSTNPMPQRPVAAIPKMAATLAIADSPVAAIASPAAPQARAATMVAQQPNPVATMPKSTVVLGDRASPMRGSGIAPTQRELADAGAAFRAEAESKPDAGPSRARAEVSAAYISAGVALTPAPSADGPTQVARPRRRRFGLVEGISLVVGVLATLFVVFCLLRLTGVL